MKALICAATLMASPALAYDTVTSQLCQDGLAARVDAVVLDVGLRKSLHGLQVQLDPDGWCVINGGQELLGLPVDQIAFRLDGAQAFVDGTGVPVGLAVQVSNWQSYDISVAVRRLPESGTLMIDRAEMRAADGSGIAATAVVQGAYFGTVANLQSSLAGLRLAELQATANVNPKLLGTLGVDLSQVTQETVDNALRDVPRWQVSTDSRTAILAFASVGDAATGELAVDLSSDRGVGFLQAVIPFTALSRQPSDDDLATAVAMAMSGVTVGVSWSAGPF